MHMYIFLIYHFCSFYLTTEKDKKKQIWFKEVLLVSIQTNVYSFHVISLYGHKGTVIRVLFIFCESFVVLIYNCITEEIEPKLHRAKLGVLY